MLYTVKLLWLIFLLFSPYLIRCTVSSIEEHDMWDNEVSPREDKKFRVYWAVKQDNITFKVEVEAKGWMLMGLTAGRDLRGTDVVLGWLKNGQMYFYDYHVDYWGNLVKDKHQDWQILSIKENKTHSNYLFSRKLFTCDPHDCPINFDTRHLYFAYSQKDPYSERDIPKDISWQKTHFQRLEVGIKKSMMPMDLARWDVLADNFALPKERNSFCMCKIVKSPRLNKKHHVIKISPVIEKKNFMLVHHIVLFSCSSAKYPQIKTAMDYGPVECYQPGIPTMFSRCNNPYAIWGFDGGPVLYPNHIGQPLYGTDEEYFMLLVHYDNSKLLKGVVDNSGLRFYLTSRLRPNDAANLLIGATASPVNIIPPKVKEFMTTGHASAECLSKGIPENGIKVTGAFLHAHFIATKVQIRHFRRNKELAPLASNSNFDKHYQRYTYLEKDRIILPGDQLTVECTYNSMNRNITTFGGIDSHEEICQANLIYYPPMTIGQATTAPTLELIAGLAGLNLYGGYNTSLRGEQKIGFTKYLEKHNWSKRNICILQDAIRYSPQMQKCGRLDGSYIKLPHAAYPEKLQRYVEKEPCKSKISTGKTKLLPCNYN